jgi:hypothetical protein
VACKPTRKPYLGIRPDRQPGDGADAPEPDRPLTPVDYFSSPAPAVPSRWWDEGVQAFSEALAHARVQASYKRLGIGGMWFAPVGEKRVDQVQMRQKE